MSVELKTLLDVFRAPGALCASRDDHESADFEREYERLQFELRVAESLVLPDCVKDDGAARVLFYSHAFDSERAGRDESIQDVEDQVRRLMPFVPKE